MLLHLVKAPLWSVVFIMYNNVKRKSVYIIAYFEKKSDSLGRGYHRGGKPERWNLWTFAPIISEDFLASVFVFDNLSENLFWAYVPYDLPPNNYNSDNNNSSYYVYM